MGIANGLLVASVAHARQKPKRNAFRYHVYYLCFPLSQISRLGNALLGVNRGNLFSFFERDHTQSRLSAHAWIQRILQEWKVPEADGEVVLLTMPRLFGYGFNPVSFWFCLDRAGWLRAVLSEVHNTFGDRHSYISFHEDRRPIGPDDLLHTQKIFHVSPFMAVEGEYRFRFAYGEEKLGVWIDYSRGEEALLSTSLVGKRETLNASSLLRCFFRYPLITFKVIGLIHYQAVKLLLKSARYHPRPIPPTAEITR